MNVNTQEVYSEVYGILNYLGNSYISRLPKGLYRMITEEKSSTYNPQYSLEQSLSEQGVSRESLAMIAVFHLNYWCDSEEEKQQLKELIFDNEEKHLEEMREKYNPDNMFKHHKHEIEPETETTSNVEEISMVEYKESIFKKFINKIKSIFNSK